MNALRFFDSNVLLYTVDPADLERSRTARALLDAASVDGSGVVSTQVLQEFYVNATRRQAVPSAAARAMVERFASLRVVTPDTSLILDAIDLSESDHLAFWDALIVAAAARAGCTQLVTEDLNDGQTIRGVTVHNPFRN